MSVPVITSLEKLRTNLEHHVQVPIRDRFRSFYKNVEGSELFQGDVIILTGNVKRRLRTDFALLLSNTCDMQPDREDKLLALPLYSLPHPNQMNPDERDSGYDSLYDGISKYAGSRTFYLPPVQNPTPLQSFEGMYGVFSEAVSVDANVLNSAIQKDPRLRLLTLDSVGFYIFVMKIAAHFLRPDDHWPNIF